MEITLKERLWSLFIELQHSILQIMGISFDDLIQIMLCNEKVEEKMIGILMEMKSWSQHQTSEISLHIPEYQYLT